MNKITSVDQLNPDAARIITQICVRAWLRGKAEEAKRKSLEVKSANS